MFCLNAGRGTGNTHPHLILDAVRAQGMVALATATSGIATTLLHGGRTVHTRFKVPISLTKDSYCFMPKPVKEVCKEARLIIIDENNSALCWQLAPVLPVVPKGHQAQIHQACLLKSYIWANVNVLTLVTNMRAALAGGGEQAFTQFLDQVGTGTYPHLAAPKIWSKLSKLPASMLFAPQLPALAQDQGKQMAQVQALVNHVFFDGILDMDQQAGATPPPDAQTLENLVSNKAVICPTNARVREMNCIAINSFPGEEGVYWSRD
ncbi:hypothetical protein TCAL_08419 [Tigriopus californicus]|uniref:ATP-dependent DNA helicase n=1 Tax=Tigriopus californicus TaxID=6832 RepID=A0A553N7C7_TIGCA|nr:hypothetical protein TCAL_08419 [Tigriopus californicus]|eukprot:TCALIF_08419-PA protein Name:"Protein of unknown function" AED:0.07 eAED:0.26 QI:0/0/0/1/1/1/2/0/263